MKILYIHGYNGTPDGPKPAMLRKEYRSAEIFAPQHDSIPNHVFQLFDGIASTLDSSTDVIIGNSLGGFWANFFSLRYGIPALLINPAVSPSKSLKRLGCSFAEEYSPYEEKVKSGDISPRTVLLAEDDEVLSYQEAYELFSELCLVQVLKSGGHGMNDPASIAMIRDSIPSLIGSSLSWGIHNNDD